MQRTLPALIALVAAASVATGDVMAQTPQYPPHPHAQGEPRSGEAHPGASHPGVKPEGASPAGKPAGPPAHQPNSLGADWRLQQDEVRQQRQQRRIMPLSRVIEQINARSPGRQLDAGLEYQGDRPIYRVRWMTRNGRRVDYLIDAATGAILSGG